MTIFLIKQKGKNMIVNSENQLSKLIFDAALRVHKSLGPGLLESAYEECMFYELNKLDITVERQKALPLTYKDVIMEKGFRLDLIIDNKVIIEIKAVECFTEVHMAQMLTYLKQIQ